MSNSIQYLDLPSIFGAIQQIRSGQQRSQLLDLQSQTAQKQQEAQQALLAALPADQQALFRADPSGYLGATFERMKPQKPVPVTEGGALVDPGTGQVMYERPKQSELSFEGGVAAPTPAPGDALRTAAPPPAPAANGPPVSLAYADGVQSRENTTGNATAANRNSSAVGNHQFLKGTWLDMIRTHRPDLAQGKTDEQILALRGDATLSAEMATRYAQDNTPILSQAGFEATPTNLAILHAFGPTGGLKILQAEKVNPNTPLSSVLSEEALAANPELRTMTIAQGRAQVDEHMKGVQNGGTRSGGADADPPGVRRILVKGRPDTTGADPGYQWAVDGQGNRLQVPIRGSTVAADKAADRQRAAVRTMTPDELAQHGLPPGTSAQIDGNGRISILKPVDPAAAKPNNDQTLAHGFANRMQASLGTINQLEEKGWKGPGFLERNVGDLPGGNYAMSAEYQQYERAKRDFISAILRKESGAAIGKDEYSSADKQYFPQPGDDPAALADKKRARDLAVSNMREASGPLNKPAANASGGDRPDPNNPQVGDRARNSQTGAMIEWNGSAWVAVQ